MTKADKKMGIPTKQERAFDQPPKLHKSKKWNNKICKKTKKPHIFKLQKTKQRGPCFLHIGEKNYEELYCSIFLDYKCIDCGKEMCEYFWKVKKTALKGIVFPEYYDKHEIRVIKNQLEKLTK